MSPPRVVRLKRGRRIMRARGRRASRRHGKQDECYVETGKVLMILPHPLARGRISMAPPPLRREVARGIKINDTRR